MFISLIAKIKKKERKSYPRQEDKLKKKKKDKRNVSTQRFKLRFLRLVLGWALGGIWDCS